jgi:hypothetical protein
VAKIEAPSEARTHLEQLGTSLQVRGWKVSLTTTGGRPRLKVTNPTAAELSETIHCRRAGDDWLFLWSWAEVIGPVEKIDAVGRQIRHVLSTIPEPKA